MSTECNGPPQSHDFEEIVNESLRDGVSAALQEETELYLTLLAEFCAHVDHLAETHLGDWSQARICDVRGLAATTSKTSG